MVGEITVSQVLAYYDGPQIIEAKDRIGGHYVGLAIEPNGEPGDFAIVGVTPHRLWQFRSGEIDLLDLMIDRPEGLGWHLASFSAKSPNILEMGPERPNNPEPQMLPERGFILRGTVAVDELVAQARQLNSPLMEITLDPPEAAEDHVINSETLGQFLLVFQRLVKHAFRAWLRGAPSQSVGPNSFVLRVRDLVPGSVKLIVQPDQAQNLFGANDAGPAIQIVQNLIESARNPESAVEQVYLNRGHVATAYVNLLDLLIENETRLQVSATDSMNDTVRTASISKAEASAVRTRLATGQVFDGEPVTVIGTLDKVDKTRGTWRMQTSSGDRNGQTDEDGPSLYGLVIGSQYRFETIEKVELTPTGRERTVLYLRSHHSPNTVPED